MHGLRAEAVLSDDNAPCDGLPAAAHFVERITQLEAENARLRRQNLRYHQLVERDPVTGLFSRRHFDARLHHEWSRAEKMWTPLSLLVVAVDDFALLRERHGLDGCHRLLAQVGELLESTCRDVDVPCRIALDSFAVILPATNRTGAEGELKRLEARWLMAAPSNRGPAALRLCFGMAVAFDDAQTPLELLMLADEAMIVDKRCLSDETPTSPHLGSPTWIDAA